MELLRNNDRMNGLYRVNPVLFARELLRIELMAFQTAALNPATMRGILNCSRQAGKTLAMAIKAVHLTFTVARTNVLVLAATLDQAGRFFRVIEEQLGQLGVRIERDGVHKYSAVLRNGSSIVALSAGQKFRGLSAVHLLLVDEAAEVPDEAFHAVTPMLSTTAGQGPGGIWLMSTPQGKRGFFWDIWSEGGEGWKRICIPATEVPRFTPEWLAEERARKGELRFRQEYLCEVVDTPDSLFREDLVRRAISKNVPRLRL